MDAIDRHVKQIIGNAVLKAYRPRPTVDPCELCRGSGAVSTRYYEGPCPDCQGTGEDEE